MDCKSTESLNFLYLRYLWQAGGGYSFVVCEADRLSFVGRGAFRQILSHHWQAFVLIGYSALERAYGRSTGANFNAFM